MPRIIRRSVGAASPAEGDLPPVAPSQPTAPVPTPPVSMGTGTGAVTVEPPHRDPVIIPTHEGETAKFRSFLANAVTGIFGITGAGKSSLADTAAEEAWETYGAITLCYASDLGGFGTKRLSLIRHGIMRVWYLRNHTNPFDTMQFASLGYWPETFVDPEAGLTAPDARLIAPIETRFTLVCPNGHDVVTYKDQAQLNVASAPCPTCGQVTSPLNAKEIRRVLVRPAMFRRVGHRIYDSMTQLCEWGADELTNKSARGDLPSGATGGSVLGSADGVRESAFVFGTGSKAQVGFMQNRVPAWIANIRAVQGHVIPPTMTFGVEVSKGDDESGGQVILGPKISGNARTSSVPGWLGNCLYAAREVKQPNDVDPNTGIVKMYHRLWLTTHVDPRDARAIPIVSKHRGEPIGMPLVLEDPYIEIEPATGLPRNPEAAWSRCSLRVFYGLLRQQAEAIEKRDAAKFAHVPSLDADEGEDEVVSSTVLGEGGNAATSMPINSSRVIRRSRRPGASNVAGAPAVSGSGSTTTPATTETATSGPVVEHGDRPAAAQTPPEEVPAAVAPTAAAGVQTSVASPIVTQLTAALAHEQAKTELTAATPVAPVIPPAPTTGGSRVLRRPRPPA